jgi:hypothetical protein
MDFLKHREGVIVYYQVFLLSPLQCTATKLRLLSGFRPRIRPLYLLVRSILKGKVSRNSSTER